MQERLQKLEEGITLLKERNTRVEADKAWETSWFRMLSVALVTYVIAAIVLWLIGANNVLLGSLVTTVGFILSIQSLPVIKRWWIEKMLQ